MEKSVQVEYVLSRRDAADEQWETARTALCCSEKGRYKLKDCQTLLKRVQRRTQKQSSVEIEADITAARAEVKAKRREAYRLA